MGETIRGRHFSSEHIELIKQFIKTYFEDGIAAHVSMDEPICSNLAQTAFNHAQKAGLKAHLGGTYYNMEGPQFSSKAESKTYRTLGYSIIGMTLAIEAKLAKELESLDA